SIGIKEKDKNKPYDAIPERLIFGYACEDAENTFDLYNEVTPYYKYEIEAMHNIYRMEREVLKVCSNLEFHGLCMDYDYLIELKSRIEADYVKDTEEFIENWGSYRNTKGRIVSAVERTQRYA